MSDPNNLFVPRCVDAGRLVQTASEELPGVVLHNGIQVLSRSYYGDFAEVLETNLGVHEGAEERLFGEVLPLLPPGSVMLELGSYWAMYSTWFGRAVRGARLFLVEASAQALGIGLRNLAHNRLQPELATRGYVGIDVNVSSLVASRGLRHVHMLHADIQGEEVGMLTDIAPLLRARRVSYIFLSTHSQEVHLSCLETLRSHGYRIIGQTDVDSDTFFFDGIIVASEPSLTAPAAVDLGSRRATPQRKGPFDGMRTRLPCPYALNPDAGGGTKPTSERPADVSISNYVVPGTSLYENDYISCRPLFSYQRYHSPKMIIQATIPQSTLSCHLHGPPHHSPRRGSLETRVVTLPDRCRFR